MREKTKQKIIISHKKFFNVLEINDSCFLQHLIIQIIKHPLARIYKELFHKFGSNLLRFTNKKQKINEISEPKIWGCQHCHGGSRRLNIFRSTDLDSISATSKANQHQNNKFPLIQASRASPRPPPQIIFTLHKKRPPPIVKDPKFYKRYKFF